MLFFRENRLMHDDSRDPSVLFDVTRRGFVVSSLAAGYALATQPVLSADNLDGHEWTRSWRSEDQGRRWRNPGLSGHACRGGAVSSSPGGAGDFRRPRAHQRHVPAAGEAGYLAVAAEMYARQGDVSGLSDFRKSSKIVCKVPDKQVMSDLDADRRLGQGDRQGDVSKLAIPDSAGAGGSCGCTRPTTPSLKAGVAWYGRLVKPPQANELQPKYPIEVVAS